MKQNLSRNQLYGVLALAGTALLWSTSGMLIKLIPWNPFTIAGGRSLIASIVILLIIRKPKLHFSFYQVAAALAHAATMILFIAANKYTTSANAIVLQYVCPITTALLAALILKEKTRIEHWVAVFFVMLGMVIIFLDKLGRGQIIGNVLALSAALTFSFVFIFMRKQKDGSPLESFLLSHWITAAIGLGVTLFLPMPVFTLPAMGAITAMGIFQIGFASVLFSYGIKRISAVNANLITVIEPVFNPIWVLIIIGETPTINTIVGGVIIIAAVTGASIISARRGNGNMKEPVPNKKQKASDNCS
jgi:drug/metabolite transporter (DMT)-like permease